MDDKDPAFVELHKVLDSFFHQLHSDGVGTRPIRSEIIRQEEEEILWNSGVLGNGSPKQLYLCTSGNKISKEHPLWSLKNLSV